MKTIQSNTVFTNVAKTSDGGVYWEGIDEDHVDPNASITSWKNQENWKPGDKANPAAHPNSRFVHMKLKFCRSFFKFNCACNWSYLPREK